MQCDMFDHKRYNKDQCEAIKLYKWQLSERAGYDLGRKCTSEWIKKYAKIFRKIAEMSGEYSHEDPKLNMIEFWADLFHSMEVHKWVESEKAGRDLGYECEYCWLKENTEKFLQESILAKKYNIS